MLHAIVPKREPVRLKQLTLKIKPVALAFSKLHRGVCRNFEKGFPLSLIDCYIRIVCLYYLTVLLEYLDFFTRIIIQNNAISVAIMFKLLFN